MRKQAKYTYRMMNQDISKSKHSNEIYWEAKNIRVITNSDFGSYTNPKGNDLVVTLPTITSNTTGKTLSTIGFPITDLVVIHSQNIDDKIILFSTNGNADCIWLLEESLNGAFTTTLLYVDDLGWSKGSQIESVGINESEEAQKVYWVDGYNNPRFINIVDPDLLSTTKDQISFNPIVTLLDPTIEGSASGGTHKAGVIQYAYNLYNKYGVQTKVSGTSPLVYLGDGDKGLSLNAPSSISPIVKISDINQKFDYIRVYSIYYSSLNQTPKISLIYEAENVSTSLTITDTNDIIQEISLSEYNLLGPQKIIPRHIAAKDNNLFFANYKTESYSVDDYDTRAFSFKRTAVTGGFTWSATFKHIDSKYSDYEVWDTNSVSAVRPAGTISFNTFINTVPIDHDCINDDEEAVYQPLTSVIGGKGKNVEYEIIYVNKDMSDPDSTSKDTSVKRGEKYRVGLTFYNEEDIESFVNWMADVKIPGTGEPGYISPMSTAGTKKLARVRVRVYSLPTAIKAFRLVRVERKEKDRRIKAQGIVNPTILQQDLAGDDKLRNVYPNYIQRIFNSSERIPAFSPTLVAHTEFSGGNIIQGMRFQKPRNFHLPTSATDNPLTYTLDGIAATYNYGEISRDTNAGSVNASSYGQSKNGFTFNSPEVTFSKTKLALNVNYEIRTVGFARNYESISDISFTTNYNLKTEEADILDERLRLTYTAYGDIIYMFQVDEKESASGLPAPVVYENNTPLPKVFFKIVNDADQIEGDQCYLIGSIRPRFTTTVDGINYIFNRWETKTCFYHRKFDKFLGSSIIPIVSTIKSNGQIIYVPPILNRIALTDVDGGSSSTPTEFNSAINPVIEIGGYTKMSSYAGSCLYFDSRDLHNNAFDYYDSLTSGSDSHALIIEFFDNDISQYGGNTYVERQRNVYIPFSIKFKNAIQPSQLADAIYGDTFIQECAILRVFANQSATTAETKINEIVTYVGETYINNDMRYDDLKEDTGGNVYDENVSYGYNSVYNQETILNKSISKPSDFVESFLFRSEVVATAPKVLGEFIDSWTAVSVNDRITLDTKYGGITGFGLIKDNLYTFQRNAIAYLAINPRVQVSASDGIPILLGSGDLIERYQYITTNSGTLHSKSILNTETGIYYFDMLNQSINRVAGQVEELSTVKGMYNYFKDFVENNEEDLLKNVQGTNLDEMYNVISYYDRKNEDVLFSFNIQSSNSFTIGYNLLADGFTSFYNFIPSVYFDIRNTVFTSNGSNRIWKHDVGEYNKFYDIYYPSEMTILFNQEPDVDKVIDNMNFIQDTTLNGVDSFNTTFTSIQGKTAYQDTGEVTLTYGGNIRRKFREYNLVIPREQSTRNRLRGPYALLTLKFNHPENNYKFIMHDTLVYYTIN